MNLQEQINRINQMMGLLTENKRQEMFYDYLDKEIHEKYGEPYLYNRKRTKEIYGRKADELLFFVTEHFYKLGGGVRGYNSVFTATDDFGHLIFTARDIFGYNNCNNSIFDGTTHRASIIT